MRVRTLMMVGLVAAGSASAVTAQRTVDPVSTTAVSGYTSSDVTWLSVGGAGNVAIKGLTWREDADKPCHMAISERGLAEATPWDAPSMDICGIVSSYLIATATERVLSFDANPRYFLRGIAVCNNDKSNHRLKGIRIYAAKVWSTQQQVDELTMSQQTSLTNCDRWDSAVYCPADNVASAVVVHHNNKEITGLALRCRPIDY